MPTETTRLHFLHFPTWHPTREALVPRVSKALSSTLHQSHQCPKCGVRSAITQLQLGFALMASCHKCGEGRKGWGEGDNRNQKCQSKDYGWVIQRHRHENGMWMPTKEAPSLGTATKTTNLNTSEMTGGGAGGLGEGKHICFTWEYSDLAFLTL